MLMQNLFLFYLIQNVICYLNNNSRIKKEISTSLVDELSVVLEGVGLYLRYHKFNEIDYRQNKTFTNQVPNKPKHLIQQGMTFSLAFPFLSLDEEDPVIADECSISLINCLNEVYKTFRYFVSNFRIYH